MDSPLSESPSLRAICDAIPSLVFLADHDVQVLDANRAAREWLGADSGLVLRQAGGEVMRCVFALSSAGGCGTTEACPTCVLRESVAKARPGRPAASRVAHMVLETPQRAEDRWFRVTAAPVVLDGRDLVLVNMEDVSQLVELREVLPVCPGCGTSPRDAKDVLREARTYLARHPGHWSTSELCPDCMRTKPPAPWREGVI